MKLFLSALCASLIVSPLAFAGKCEKKECDKEKKEETILADCGKCKKDGDKGQGEGRRHHPRRLRKVQKGRR